VKVQTSVPAAVGAWLERRADGEGVVLAQVARDILVAAFRRQHVRGWLVRREDATSALARRDHALAVYIFDVVEHRPNGDLVVAVLHGEANPPHVGRVVTQSYLRETLDELFSHVAILDGSPSPWRILSSWFDSGSQRMIFTLQNPNGLTRPTSELVVVGDRNPGGFFCFVRDPAGRRCRVTTLKASEQDARVAAERWIDEALLEGVPLRVGYTWIADSEFPDLHVCLRIGESSPYLK